MEGLHDREMAFPVQFTLARRLFSRVLSERNSSIFRIEMLCLKASFPSQRKTFTESPGPSRAMGGLTTVFTRWFELLWIRRSINEISYHAVQQVRNEIEELHAHLALSFNWADRLASLVRVLLFLSCLRAPRAVLTELLLAVCLVPTKAQTLLTHYWTIIRVGS